MPKILTLGEMLIDFTQCKSDGEELLYKQNAGGAPANVAIQASILGGDCGFIGRVGNDNFGHFLEKTLKSYNVNTYGMSFDEQFATALAFVQIFNNGVHNFTFYRNPGADTRLTFEDIDLKLIDECEILHFGSLSLTAEPSRTAILKAVEYAREKGKIISYDPNWREALWSSKQEGLAAMRSVLKYCDIIKVSEDELKLLTDCDILIQGIASLLKMDIKIVIVTQGARGCVTAYKNELERIPTYDTSIVDTTGAGDSFFGGFLYKLIENGKPIDELTVKECIAFADFANACGALTSAAIGAVSAMPDRKQVEDCMKNTPKFIKR